jgi:hypothetical protein
MTLRGKIYIGFRFPFPHIVVNFPAILLALSYPLPSRCQSCPESPKALQKVSSQSEKTNQASPRTSKSAGGSTSENSRRDSRSGCPSGYHDDG